MTNKEKAQAFMAIASDPGAKLEDRQVAWNAINELKRSAKTSFEKLGVSDEWRSACMTDLLTGETGLEVVTDPLDEMPAPLVAAVMPEQLAKDPAIPEKVVAANTRGLITAEVKRLLGTTDMPYAEIEAAVRAKYPDAKTTARSIASTASDMRKAKIDVPMRRAVVK